MSVNEEFQSTNEELLTSKEELQSLNEELTALNSQLQETLERQRTTSNDLQNVLYSTDVATLFLDTDLNIRFFTPATKSLFSVIPSDVGRPLADLNSLAADDALLTDARTVLQTLAPIEREIEAQNGAWYIRRILPYRTQDNGVEGVVITFADITERRRTADALEAAKRQAELANAAKSRFLAAASHDLRQPLQTLALLQGLLAKTVEGERAQKLVARLDETLGAMSGMLNTLLDINQIEAGTVRAEMVGFPINDLLDRLRDEFAYHAQAQGLVLRVVPCGLSIDSDPRLLEQMIRNLLSNALKYTKRGKVLLGCRRHEGNAEHRGLGHRHRHPRRRDSKRSSRSTISSTMPRANAAAASASVSPSCSAWGICWAIGYVSARSRARARSSPSRSCAHRPTTAPQPERPRHGTDDGIVDGARHTGAILVVEDDPEVRELLELLLKDEGHRVATAPDGIAALDLVARGTVRPDLILADYNLPNGMNGLQLIGEAAGRASSPYPGHHSDRRHLDRYLARYRAPGLRPAQQAGEAEGADAGHPASPPDSAGRAVHARSAPGRGGRQAPDRPSSSSSTTTATCARRSAPCSRKTAGPSRTMRPARPSSKPIVQAARRCLLVDAYLPGMSGLELLQQAP